MTYEKDSKSGYKCCPWLQQASKDCHYFNISYVVTAAHCFSDDNTDNFAVAPESLTLAFGLDNITVLEDPILPTILKIQKRTNRRNK